MRRGRCRRRSGRSCSPCSRSNAALPIVAPPPRWPVHHKRRRQVHDAARHERGQRRLRGRPRVLGIVKHLHLGAPAVGGRDLRRAARLDDPVHRGQRRHHRRPRAWSTRWACTGRCPTRLSRLHPALLHAMDRHPAVRRRRLPDDHPRQGRIPRQHVRVRGDAVVHDRPPVGDPAADQGNPTGPRPLPGGPARWRVAGRELPLFAVLGVLGTGLAFVVVTVLHLAVAAAGVFLARLRDDPIRRLPQNSRASTCARPSRRRAPSARSTSRSSTTARRSCRSSARTSAPSRASATPPS